MPAAEIAPCSALFPDEVSYSSSRYVCYDVCKLHLYLSPGGSCQPMSALPMSKLSHQTKAGRCACCKTMMCPRDCHRSCVRGTPGKITPHGRQEAAL